MPQFSQDDVHYALEMTQVVYEPDRRIDTFGSTQFQFHLVTELMDKANEIRVRTGQIEAERPQILRPEPYEDFDFEGFGEQAAAFGEWFKEHGGDLSFLKYGFSFRKNDMTEEIVHDPFPDVIDRVVGRVRDAQNPLSAVIHGVDDTWEICLLKFTLDMIQKSHGINVFDFKRRGLL